MLEFDPIRDSLALWQTTLGAISSRCVFSHHLFSSRDETSIPMEFAHFFGAEDVDEEPRGAVAGEGGRGPRALAYAVGLTVRGEESVRKNNVERIDHVE